MGQPELSSWLQFGQRSLWLAQAQQRLDSMLPIEMKSGLTASMTTPNIDRYLYTLARDRDPSPVSQAIC